MRPFSRHRPPGHDRRDRRPKQARKAEKGRHLQEGIHRSRQGVRQNEERSQRVAFYECLYGSHGGLLFSALPHGIVTRCIFSCGELP
jgi:hypothetical protein